MKRTYNYKVYNIKLYSNPNMKYFYSHKVYKIKPYIEHAHGYELHEIELYIE